MGKKESVLERVNLERYLESHGVSRRDFLTFCSTMAATLALPAGFANAAEKKITADKRPSVIWVEMQSCTGDTESLLRASRPTAAELVLDYLSIDYQDAIMAAAGHQAEEAMYQAAAREKGKYILVVEGSIPVAKNGIYCMIAGKSAVQIVKELGENAAAVISVGTCAAYGGIAAGSPNPTDARGVAEILPGKTVINLPGCPMNVVNLTATIVHLLTIGAPPALDKHLRPLFAYGKRIHDNCERRAHFDQGQFVEAWDDLGHKQGWCLYKMGCKGPSTFHNCPTVQYNDGQSWPVKAGHGCVGCSEPGFWDSMGPFYERLPNVPGYGADTTATKVGLGIVATVGAGVAVHGVIKAISHRFCGDDRIEPEK